jgi:hypothetical protein
MLKSQPPWLPASARQAPLARRRTDTYRHPSAVAEPVTPALLETYSTWLHYECRMVAIEMAMGGTERAHAYESWVMTNAGSKFYFSGPTPRYAIDHPSSRAALVLSAMGCNWRGEG